MSSEGKDETETPAALVRDSAQAVWDDLEESLKKLRFVIQTCDGVMSNCVVIFVQNFLIVEP